MSAGAAASWAWLGPLLEVLPQPVSRIIHAAEAGLEEGQPTPDYGDCRAEVSLLHLPADERGAGDWRACLAALLREGDEGSCLVNAVEVPQWTLAAALDTGRCTGAGALVAEAVRVAPPATTVCCLVPHALLTGDWGQALRAHLARRGCLSWVVYFGESAARALGVHPSFRMAALVLQPEVPRPAGEARVLRLVNLAALEPARWPGVLRDAGLRQGGETAFTIVRRDAGIDDQPWTFEQFSQRLGEVLTDVEALGELRPLGDLLADLSLGRPLKVLHAAGATPGVDAGDRELLPCLSGTCLTSDGEVRNAEYSVRRSLVADSEILAAGDLLIRSTFPPRQAAGAPLVAAEARDEDLPATFDQSLLRLRWTPDLPVEVREVLTAYLRSQHAADWLQAQGLGTDLAPSLLRRLPVPDPLPGLIGALAGLRAAEMTYLRWAASARATRERLFAAGSFAEAVPGILSATKEENERLRAAEDSQTFGYRVRNYYPHPIALRREGLLHLDHGEARLGATLECAEHLMVVLALMATVQLAEGDDESLALPPGRVTAAAAGGKLHLSWGLCRELLRDGLARTRKHPNPLLLPFPGLLTLSTVAEDHGTPWSLAEAAMREQRNRLSHLERRPASELADLSSAHQVHLDTLIEGAGLLTDHPLVYVEDYALDLTRGERVATVQLLQGISTAFPRQRRDIRRELPRGVVAILDGAGELRTLYPWLLREPCEVCRRMEVFVFSRLDRTDVTYVAMETGHSHSKPELRGRWEQLLRGGP